MEDLQKAKLLNELISSQAFQAQVALEDQTISSWQSKLQTIDLLDSNVAIKFAEARGAIEALKAVKAVRQRLVDEARSSKPKNS